MARVSMIAPTGRERQATRRSGAQFPATAWQKIAEIGRILALSVFSPQTLIAEERSWPHQGRSSAARDGEHPTATTKVDNRAWHMSW